MSHMSATATRGTRQIHLRLPVTLGLIASLGLGLLTSSPESRAGTLGCTPNNFTRDGAVMVVSDNIYESKVPDANDASDVNRFVARLLEQTATYKPVAGYDIVPDIVLVQEVRKVAVVNVKNKLNQLTGCTYSIPANASKPPSNGPIHKRGRRPS